MYDDDSGYELDDPKHPSFADRYADWTDTQRKRDKEQQHMDEEKRDQADQES